MNWPNRITIARVALIPVIVILLQFDVSICRALALVCFMVASFTDWLDGYLARKLQIVTNFGKFLDPVADKLLVLSTMIALCGLGDFPAWVCIVVLFRELAVDGLRMVAVEQGHVIAAGKLGKIKTALQMLTLILVLLDTRMFGDFPMTELMIYASVAMTLWSGLDYFIRNGAVLKQGGRAA
ncbi:MAG TPA: CDP-diacylglycerol--glycerol-3-phosphate 3-phosphatidyltransferase [Candidatus Limiplasma sp.]|nr:CDP-diacylglycerol--glycerol-3-phosphate 3-phosphatidyltransferase [Candidatus Limiplasma sp.]HPS81435.1 CDP-diacylglycerol--glycerol-3-phosphate 3-phosphatidyltransferase [Candidatus Limiplasma sp.]